MVNQAEDVILLIIHQLLVKDMCSPGWSLLCWKTDSLWNFYFEKYIFVSKIIPYILNKSSNFCLRDTCSIDLMPSPPEDSSNGGKAPRLWFFPYFPHGNLYTRQPWSSNQVLEGSQRSIDSLLYQYHITFCSVLIMSSKKVLILPPKGPSATFPWSGSILSWSHQQPVTDTRGQEGAITPQIL